MTTRLARTYRTPDPSVVSIVLNWNGWSDTAECLDSLLRSSFPRHRIVVCDNGSQDGSLTHLRQWAEAR
ncbi:MAG TPA: glycosyltransferase, partial [Candidatus Baltobacteraceae bacterium]